MTAQRGNAFRFASSTGAEVSVDLSKMNLDASKIKVLEKISRDSGPAKLTREEWESIKDIKAGVGGVPGSTGLIVRFDWTWVTIDERIRDFDELTNPGVQLKG